MTDLESNIFRDKNNIYLTQSTDTKQEEEFFTLSGLGDDNESINVKNEEKNNVFAKKITRKNGSFKFLIKTNANGKLYNPITIYGQDKENNFLDKICRSNSKFVEVNQKTFDLYLNFLISKNIAWLNNAERERE
jgi:hypothetical protein